VKVLVKNKVAASASRPVTAICRNSPRSRRGRRLAPDKNVFLTPLGMSITAPVQSLAGRWRVAATDAIRGDGSSRTRRRIRSSGTVRRTSSTSNRSTTTRDRAGQGVQNSTNRITSPGCSSRVKLRWHSKYAFRALGRKTTECWTSLTPHGMYGSPTPHLRHVWIDESPVRRKRASAAQRRVV